jgi:hypothetical protein
MRWHEIVSPRDAAIAEATAKGGSGGVAPLSPAQSRARQRKRERAIGHVADVQAANAERLRAAKAKLSEV